jgi:hypothetical protein
MSTKKAKWGDPRIQWGGSWKWGMKAPDDEKAEPATAEEATRPRGVSFSQAMENRRLERLARGDAAKAAADETNVEKPPGVENV